MRRFACQVLEREGFTTIEAADGAEALRIVEHAAPAIALVLSDIRMPKLDGIQLERTCRGALARIAGPSSCPAKSPGTGWSGWFVKALTR